MEGESSILDDVKEEEPYEDPDDDLCEKIVTQVEFYFSDANITKDKFLLKVRFWHNTIMLIAIKKIKQNIW